MILLTPGPCMTSESVRQAAAMPDMNHREPAFRALMGEVRERLRSLYGLSDEWRPYLIGGSGTAAVEAMVTSCIGKEGKCLILASGYYSERLDAIFRVYNMPHETLRFGWREPWDFDRIEERLRSGSFEAVLGTHNETTTGRLNDIGRLGELCRRFGSRCLIDAISSFGAEAIPFDRIDAVVATANKCLHGLPGVAFAMLSSEMRTVMRQIAPRSYYLDLRRYSSDDPPLTPPVPALAALRQALREFPEGGFGARHEHYRAKLEQIRAGLAVHGLHALVPQSEATVTVATFPAPPGMDAARWIDVNRQRGFLLYGCKGELQSEYFQASVMGELAKEDIDRWLSCVRSILDEKVG